MISINYICAWLMHVVYPPVRLGNSIVEVYPKSKGQRSTGEEWN